MIVLYKSSLCSGMSLFCIDQQFVDYIIVSFSSSLLLNMPDLCCKWLGDVLFKRLYTLRSRYYMLSPYDGRSVTAHAHTLANYSRPHMHTHLQIILDVWMITHTYWFFYHPIKNCIMRVIVSFYFWRKKNK